MIQGDPRDGEEQHRAQTDTGTHPMPKRDLANPERLSGSLRDGGLNRGGQGLNLGPHADEVVINAGELHGGRMVRRIRAETLDRKVHVEEQTTLRI